MDKQNKKLHFAQIPRTKNDWVSYKEKSSDDYIKSGEDNLFPQHLIQLYNRSSVHAACVNAVTEAIIGGGLKANEEAFLAKANKKETWNDVFRKAATDYYLQGAFALEIIWSLDRSRIAEVYHIDFSQVRAADKDRRGHIPGYYISTNWRQSTRTSNDEVEYLCSFDQDLAKEHPNQIYVSHKYRAGQQFYPLPVYNGALKIIELDCEIDTFHVSNIKNGLAPSLAITTYMNGSDDDVSAVEQMLRANYGGADNAGSLLYMDLDSPDNKPDITPIPQNGADGYYQSVNDMSMQKILTAHRITSPMMLGIKESGQLGGRAEVIDAYLLFSNMVIEPYQQDILRCFEMILEVNYPGIVIGVESKRLYEDGDVEEEVVTSVEVSDTEDEQINQDTNDSDLFDIGDKA